MSKTEWKNIPIVVQTNTAKTGRFMCPKCFDLYTIKVSRTHIPSNIAMEASTVEDAEIYPTVTLKLHVNSPCCDEEMTRVDYDIAQIVKNLCKKNFPVFDSSQGEFGNSANFIKTLPRVHIEDTDNCFRQKFVNEFIAAHIDEFKVEYYDENNPEDVCTFVPYTSVYLYNHGNKKYFTLGMRPVKSSGGIDIEWLKKINASKALYESVIMNRALSKFNMLARHLPKIGKDQTEPNNVYYLPSE